MPTLADVHHQALEPDARGDCVEYLVGLRVGVKAAVLQRWAVVHTAQCLTVVLIAVCVDTAFLANSELVAGSSAVTL